MARVLKFTATEEVTAARGIWAKGAGVVRRFTAESGVSTGGKETS